MDTHPELPLDPDVVSPGIFKWPPHFTPALMLVVFVGGCLGTSARYWIALKLAPAGGKWPFATFIVNMLGALLLGFLLEGLARLGSDGGARRIARLGLGTGFLGGFTTYSTFAVETDLLVNNSYGTLAVQYAVTTLIAGLLCSTLGILIAASHHKFRKGDGA